MTLVCEDNLFVKKESTFCVSKIYSTNINHYFLSKNMFSSII